MMIEMELVEIETTGDLGPQIMILKEKDGDRYFPIFIGNYEVHILEQSVKGIETTRPLTHDLVLNVVDDLGGTLTGVLVDSLKQDTFYGKLLVRNGDGDTIRIDSRPSDAIVLAVKRRVPIYVEQEVLDVTTGDEDTDDDA